jgi:cytochrome c biogenesis protein CcdA
MPDADASPSSPPPIWIAEVTERPPQPLTFEGDLPPGWRLKAESGAWVAKAILWIFGGALSLILLCGFVVIVIGTIYHSPKAGDTAGQNSQTLVKDAVLPFIQGVATFASTVFSPLLAFILGYYFGEKGRQTSRD